MARFVFKLESALRQRKNVEQQIQRELSAKLALLTSMESELKRVEQVLRESNVDLVTNRLTGNIDLHFLAAQRRYTNAMQRQGVAIVQKIASQRRVVEEIKQQLVEASKRRKAIERLREKRLEQWKLEQSGRELRELDEIGMQIGLANLSGSDES